MASRMSLRIVSIAETRKKSRKFEKSRRKSRNRKVMIKELPATALHFECLLLLDGYCTFHFSLLAGFTREIFSARISDNFSNFRLALWISSYPLPSPVKHTHIPKPKLRNFQSQALSKFKTLKFVFLAFYFYEFSSRVANLSKFRHLSAQSLLF